MSGGRDPHREETIIGLRSITRMKFAPWNGCIRVSPPPPIPWGSSAGVDALSSLRGAPSPGSSKIGPPKQSHGNGRVMDRATLCDPKGANWCQPSGSDLSELGGQRLSQRDCFGGTENAIYLHQGLAMTGRGHVLLFNSPHPYPAAGPRRLPPATGRLGSGLRTLSSPWVFAFGLAC